LVWIVVAQAGLKGAIFLPVSQVLGLYVSSHLTVFHLIEFLSIKNLGAN
jgi:hypothetical protein